MATCTLLTARLKRAIGTAGFASAYSDADLMAQLNSSMLTIARRVKLQKLSASASVYSNTQTFSDFDAAGGSTTVEADLAIDYNPTAGADTKLVEIEIDGVTTPNTFKHRINSGTWTTGVAITGLSQTIYKKISVTFANTTGYTVGDNWDFTAYADLPSDFHYGLIRIERASTTNLINMLASYQELRELYPLLNRTSGYWGNPGHAAIGELKQLFVVPQPSSQETLKIFYQKKPTAFTTGSDDLDMMGDEYQYTCLVYHAAKEILEDSAQAELANRMMARYEEELARLDVEEGVNDDIVETIRDNGLWT